MIRAVVAAAATLTAAAAVTVATVSASAPTVPASAASPLLAALAARGVDVAACDVPRLPDDADTRIAYVDAFKGRAPFVLVRPLAAAAAPRALTARAPLLARFGERPVTLASSNSYSHGKLETTLAVYVDEYTGPADPAAPANETFYLFGDTVGPEWRAITDGYAQPLDAAGDEGLVVWGAGGAGSGVSFHTHGAAWGETLHGRKAWFLAAPGRDAPRGWGPDVSTLAWVLRHAGAGDAAAAADGNGGGGDGAAGNATARRHPAVLMCTCGPGDAIYVPPNWWHATLNLDDWNAFVSTFTLERGSAWAGGAGGAAPPPAPRAGALAERRAGDGGPPAPSAAGDVGGGASAAARPWVGVN